MMLCSMVRRIGHFLSVITLIWSNGHAEDPALAFFIMLAISAYVGAEVSRGNAGRGSGTNQAGSWYRQSLTESEMDMILAKYTPHCAMVNSGTAPVTFAKNFLQLAQKSAPKLLSHTGLEDRDLDCKSCLSLCERYIISSQTGDPCITGARCFSLFSFLLMRLFDHD